MPRLVLRTGSRHVASTVNNLIIRAEHCLAYGNKPGMPHNVQEPSEPLRVYLRVVSIRPARHKPTLFARLFEKLFDVLAQACDPSALECSPQRYDPGTV